MKEIYMPNHAKQAMYSYAMGGEVGPGGMRKGAYSYAMGGEIGPGGAPAPPAVPQQAMPTMGAAAPMGAAPPMQGQPAPPMPAGGDMPSPEEVEKVKGILMAMQQNPDAYQQLMQQAVSSGVMSEGDLPPQYDPELVNNLLMVISKIGELQSSGQMPMGGETALPPGGKIPVMKDGGMIPGGRNSSKPTPIMAHEGEFVIPQNVVRAKGTEFFQQMIDKYDPAKQAMGKGAGAAGAR